MSIPKIAYLSFDVVPAEKGAAVHVEAFVRALGLSFGGVELVTVAAAEPAKRVDWPGVQHTVLPAAGRTLIDRVLCFRQHLRQWLRGRKFEIVHIRSIFEGLPIVEQKSQLCQKLIFEVNGLPSIELKYRYPRVTADRELMHKLISQEQICLRVADRIITPSPITRAYLIQRNVDASCIQVIANGVDPAQFTYQPPRSEATLHRFRLLYFGTLSAWQGVDLAIQALALYRRDFEAELTIAGPSRGDQVADLQKLAHKLDVADRVHFLEAQPQAELVTLMHQADAIAAPLKPNDRNLVQGCCPLKILEGMASGTPVITSDLPVVQALGENGLHFLAGTAGSAKAIKDVMLRLRAEPDLRLRLSAAARSRIEKSFTWQRANQTLIETYESLLASARQP
ncbi:glycosyltransferase family 4 protein [Romeria aff. gracilis LEGE 07310]|uniref:Glycosyltransferase family 4 protein n=1 Tax=Vasconcelosia minhoensis LEGE 07310 TaxID=915328 RepID=A0A8J7AT72_9CYAN|nr:glycosyltransferase family 4 protein [Romeria gracilis]MBE9080025.1 glycosyltransferase family 4 protein [Romeria aff. gracilis LEGE 07310]